MKSSKPIILQYSSTKVCVVFSIVDERAVPIGGPPRTAVHREGRACNSLRRLLSFAAANGKSMCLLTVLVRFCSL